MNSSDPYRSTCTQCTHLKIELEESAKLVSALRDDAQEERKRFDTVLRTRTFRNVLLSLLTGMGCVGLFFFVGYVIKMPTPTPVCENSIKIIDKSNASQSCPAGATLTLESVDADAKIREIGESGNINASKYLFVRCRCSGLDERTQPKAEAPPPEAE